MKVIKSLSIEQDLFDWLVENRADFKKSFSGAVVRLLEATAGPSFSARDAEAKRIAQAITKANSIIERTTLERDSLLEQMKFIESRKPKQKKEESKHGI